MLARDIIGLKIRWWKHRAGSSPARGTNEQVELLEALESVTASEAAIYSALVRYRLRGRRERVWCCLGSQQTADEAVALSRDRTQPQSYNLLADRRLEYLGDLGGRPIVAAAGPPRSRVERRHTAIVHDGDFRAVIDQILDHAGPGPLYRAE
jgi:hypothetical protein